MLKIKRLKIGIAKHLRNCKKRDQKFPTKSKPVSIVGQSTIDSITTTLCKTCRSEKKDSLLEMYRYLY